MNQKELGKLLETLIKERDETEWLEFKVDNNYPNSSIGEYISALSNSACLHNKEFGYLVFGVTDKAHQIVGIKYRPITTKEGNEELENWLSRNLEPRVDFKIFEFEYDGKLIVIFKIDPTCHTPARFLNVDYIRVGTYKKKLSDYPEKERKIWMKMESKAFEEGLAFKNLGALEVLDLIDYNGYFKLTNLPIPSDNDAIIAKLEEDSLIFRNRKSYDITNLGAIFLRGT
jgi:ATP-dependent DNA helicase RecG